VVVGAGAKPTTVVAGAKPTTVGAGAKYVVVAAGAKDVVGTTAPVEHPHCANPCDTTKFIATIAVQIIVPSFMIVSFQ
jgi:hypothetical protein